MLDTLLNRIVALCRASLGDDLTGVYLHGSLAMGGFRWACSDVDFLAITERAPSADRKRALLTGLLSLTEVTPPKGLEMSVVARADCLTPACPLPFSFHYSAAHDAASRRDPDAYIQRMHGLDPDLAAHFAVTRARGRALWGAPINEVFASVPRKAYLASVWQDIAGAREDILRDPVYVTLNLCRTAAYLADGQVLSKAEGGAWAAEHFEGINHEIAAAALASYTCGECWAASAEAAVAFAKDMLARVQAAMDASP